MEQISTEVNHWLCVTNVLAFVISVEGWIYTAWISNLYKLRREWLHVSCYANWSRNVHLNNPMHCNGRYESRDFVMGSRCGSRGGGPGGPPPAPQFWGPILCCHCNSAAWCQQNLAWAPLAQILDLHLGSQGEILPTSCNGVTSARKIWGLTKLGVWWGGTKYKEIKSIYINRTDPTNGFTHQADLLHLAFQARILFLYPRPTILCSKLALLT